MSDELMKLKFPTMLRKMWSGGEVQEWLDKLPPLYTHPHSELSDEEIRKTIVKEMGEFYQNNQDAFELCKSILKKASEQ